MPDKRLNINNSLGLAADFQENGTLKSIEAGGIRISLKVSDPFSLPGTNLYLRKKSAPVEYTPLMGPGSGSHFGIFNDSYIAAGSWNGLQYELVLKLSEKSLSWKWQVTVRNNSGNSIELDLMHVQDIGLKTAGPGLVNEYYVSQYIERRILLDRTFGPVICCRQNMSESGHNPWIMIASADGAASACTDGMQFYGKTFRGTGIPEGLLQDELGGEYAGESSIVAVQGKPFRIRHGETRMFSFTATFLPDHPEASSDNDLERLPALLAEFNDVMPSWKPEKMTIPVNNIFNESPLLPAEDLNGEELNRFFGTDRRHSETADGYLLSFFSGNNTHVVLRKKELLCDRPHGSIMQSRTGLLPDESIMSTTSFAFGVFNSHITQGNTNFNSLLSICTSQFNQSIASGQRIILTIYDRQFLLGVPSAFEMGLNHCRWLYKYGNYYFQVRTWTSPGAPQVNMDFTVISGDPVHLLITHEFDPLNGWKIQPGAGTSEYLAAPDPGSVISGKFPKARFRMILQGRPSDFRTGGCEMLYPDTKGQGGGLWVIGINETRAFCMSFVGEVCAAGKAIKIIDPDDQFIAGCRDAQKAWQGLSQNLSLEGKQDDIRAIKEILPWYGMNALTHFLTPYGLEQFGGAAWGTRDVSQGPVDLLLSLGKYDEARQVLLMIFSNQNTDGGWPQWWMFDSYQEIRAGDSHGDVFYWCIIALSNYIKISGDISILDVKVPYYHGKEHSRAEKTPVSEHIDRLISMVVNSFIPGTALVPFGGGDWNDSLQPVSKELAQRMISSWTVEMNYQAFRQYQVVCELSGNKQKAGEMKALGDRIRSDFNKYLVKDGTVAGYGLVEDDGSVSVLLHPVDQKTGVHYSILPMERGILSEIFTAEQASHHLELINKHLKGPDGARLMDRPLRYKGGVQTIFQRAESSTYFGREIGLMYVHEHIRYAEALAVMGRADDFMHALRQAIPVGYREVVPSGDMRQANCYYSSSDVAFRNRYEADERYDQIKLGEITLRGGWRVYSSGPGIYISLVISRLLGLRVEYGNIIIDPVMPHSLDGISAGMDFLGHYTRFTYQIRENTSGPSAILVNGKPISFRLEENKYRRGGAVIPNAHLNDLLHRENNIITVRL